MRSSLKCRLRNWSIDSRRSLTERNSERSSTPNVPSAFVSSFTLSGGWYIKVPSSRSTKPCASEWSRRKVSASSSLNRAIDATVFSMSVWIVIAVPSSKIDAIWTSGRTYSMP